MLLIKPYILFPFVLAGGGWYYAKRSLNRGRVRIRPLYLAAAALLSIGGIVVLGHYFPEYSVDVFSSRTAELQRLGRVVRGGSSYELASEVPTTLAGQFAYAPAALLSALFRPSLFEVHNMLMLANAMETTLLTLLVIRILFTRNLDGVRQQILREPFLIFCLVFIVAFGLAVGLASTNLGTLSRYRAPLLPFFVLLILVLTRPAQMREATSESKNDAVAARRATPMAFGVPVRENGSMPYEVRSQRWNDGRKS